MYMYKYIYTYICVNSFIYIYIYINLYIYVDIFVDICILCIYRHLNMYLAHYWIARFDWELHYQTNIVNRVGKDAFHFGIDGLEKVCVCFSLSVYLYIYTQTQIYM